MFFTDPSEFTHYGRMYGIPAYFADLDSEGPVVAGTNVVFDWLILHFVPRLYTFLDWLHRLADPFYESPGWALEVMGELPKESQ